MPRNEVARFILSDLDNAINLMSDKNMATTRINKDAALLLKSRVALYEGTWLKYFKGTAFVPNGKDWGGKNKDYNANYQYPNGDIDAEIQFFLNEAMVASKEVADKYVSQLTQIQEYCSKMRMNLPIPITICLLLMTCLGYRKYCYGENMYKNSLGTMSL